MTPDKRSEILETTAAAVRTCTRCRLHRTRYRAVPGEGPIDAPVFLIGEAPGRDEDTSGRPFVGAAGKLLEQLLAGIADVCDKPDRRDAHDGAAPFAVVCGSATQWRRLKAAEAGVAGGA